MGTLPILDISDYLADPRSAAAEKTAIRLRDICHHQGFCYLIGHGMTARNNALATTAKQFFKLPRDERKSIALINAPHFRGYTILGEEQTGGKQDWRDQLDFCDEKPTPKLSSNDPAWRNLRGPNQWPKTLPELRPAVTNWMDDMHGLGSAMTAALAQGLGLGADYFAPYFVPKGDARLKLIRYHVPADSPGAGHGLGHGQGVGWHHDTGFLTFIRQDEIGGLQVDIDGEIIDATPMDGAMVMNLGEMLQVATGGYLRATSHRVKSPPPGSERQSMAYFFNPRLEAEFTPIKLPPDLAAQAIGADNIDPNDPVFNVVGENILKTRLRAHPDVAQKYYQNT